MIRKMIIDTGSDISLMQPSLIKGHTENSQLKPYEVTGKTLEVIGQQTVSFMIGDSEFRHSLICSLPTRAAGLLGTDFLKRIQVRIDLGKAVMSWSSCGREGFQRRYS
jgi:hypothetical protein